MTFADHLRTARATLALTQPQAAALLGISARVYWDWEQGLTEPAAITQEGAVARLERQVALEADANQTAAGLISAITDSEPVRGEDLFDDPKEAAEYLRIKAEFEERERLRLAKKRRP